MNKLKQPILKHIIIAMLLIPQFGLAQQQDYLVLHRGDTIQGKYISTNKYINFRTSEGKIKIPIKDVKEFYLKDKKYVVHKDPCEEGFSAYRVLIHGAASFLNSGGYEDECPDIIIINNEMYPIERKRYFSDEIWDMLSKCPDFEEKYKAYYSKHRNKRIVWEWKYRKSRTKWIEMIRYYNANCGKIAQ